MLAQKQAEEAIVSNFNETEHEGTREEVKESEDHSILSVKSILWHGGSAWDAWFSCASNQVAQVLLTLPYSFSQLGMLSGILFQIFYGLIGSWTAYLISVLYIEYRSRKEKENVNFKNHVIQIHVHVEINEPVTRSAEPHSSVEACRRNIKFNGSVASSKVESQLADARVYMLTHPKEFDMVDLDPYGSPSLFLDSAVQSVVDGGMLMCTATDLAVLCGGNGQVCYSKYGSHPLRANYCHKMALRILLGCIEVL